MHCWQTKRAGAKFMVASGMSIFHLVDVKELIHKEEAEGVEN